jgi:riboflavin kinase
MKLRGIIISGLGEGQFFFSLPPYRDGFSSALGFVPFAGTLNVRIAAGDVPLIDKLKLKPDAIVPGFSLGEKEYFQIRLVRARMLGESGALVFPYFNHHPPDVLEFVAAESMREKYKLKDGDEVELEIGK